MPEGRWRSRDGRAGVGDDGGGAGGAGGYGGSGCSDAAPLLPLLFPPSPRLQLCLGLKVTGNTCRLLLLAKASAVALAAPDGAWPPQQVERGAPRFVGLAAM